MKAFACSLTAVAALLVTPALAAVEPTLELQTYLAGSMRHLQSDFERGEDRFEGENNGSNISLTGAIKTGKVRIFTTYERGFRNDKLGIEQVRQVVGGVETPYGSIKLGKMINEYRSLGQKVDPFYDTSVVGFNGRAYGEGASYGHSNLINGFSRNAVSLKSPLLGGKVQLNGGAFVNDKDGENDKTDYTGGVLFTTALGETNQLTAGVQYLKIENPISFAAGNPTRNELYVVGGSPGESENVQAVVAFTAKRFSIGLSAENVDVKAEVRARGYAAASGTFALNDTLRLAASVGVLDFGGGSPAIEGVGYSLGLFTKLGERANGYIAARKVELDVPGDSISAAAGISFSFGGKLFPFNKDGGSE